MGMQGQSRVHNPAYRSPTSANSHDTEPNQCRLPAYPDRSRFEPRAHWSQQELRRRECRLTPHGRVSPLEHPEKRLVNSLVRDLYVEVDPYHYVPVRSCAPVLVLCDVIRPDTSNEQVASLKLAFH